MRLAPIAAVALLAAGCAGASSHVRADTARYPISLSGVVRDTNGDLAGGPQLQRVGAFSDSYTSWAMFWTLIPLWNRTRDVSEAVNQRVAAAGGDAVVNFTTVARPCISNVLTFIGLLPGCTDVEVSADIVRLVRPEAGGAASAAGGPGRPR